MTKKYIKISAYGNSMYPFFISGDILYIQPLSLSKIKINDFITYVQKNIFVTHRVIYIPSQRKYIITKGDTNQKPDKKILPEKIIGKVMRVKRSGKFFYTNTLYLLQSYWYNEEINKINTLFYKKNVNFVFLKGLPLHLYYEKSIPQRIYGDCDILIQKDQLPFVNALLSQKGYSKEIHHYSILHRVLKNKETEINYTKIVNKMPITLDIHVEPSFLMHQVGSLDALYSEKLLRSFTNDILDKKRLIRVSGKTYPILSSHHLIIYLALHIFHHNLQGYYRYEFLRMILQKETIPMQEIKNCTELYKLTSFIFPVFILLWKYYQSMQAKKLAEILPLSREAKREIIKHIQTINIFNEDTRINSGVRRFRLIFLYSPYGILKKMTVFFSLSIVYSIVWVAMKKLQVKKLQSIGYW